MGVSNRYREFKLDNGLSVVLEDRPTELIAAQLRVFHGALNEQPGEEGLAHFFEHALVSCGTEKYSPEEAIKIFGSFGMPKAETSLDWIRFPTQMIPEDIERYLDFTSQAAFHPRFDPDRLDLEKQAVLREIGNEKSKPDFRDNIDFFQALYGAHSPHAYFILGKEEVIAATDSSDMNKFHNSGFHANNAELTIVGRLPKDIEELVSKHFGGVPKGEGGRYILPNNQTVSDPGQIHRAAPDLYNEDNPDQSNAQLMFAVGGPSLMEPDTYAVTVLSHILGGGVNSRLFQRIRVQEGLAYDIGCSYNGKNNQGYILIQGNVHAARSEAAVSAIFDEMSKLGNESIDANTLETSKKQMKFGLAKLLESCEGGIYAIDFGRDYGFTTESHLAGIDAVSAQDVMRAANKYLPKNREDGMYVLLLRDPLKQ